MNKEDVGCTHTHNGLYLSYKKNEFLPFLTTWKDLEGIMVNEMRERQILYDFIFKWNLKKKKKEMNKHKKQKQIHRYRE